MKILSIDTSAAPASCALLDGDVLLGESYINVRLTHSQTILPMVEGMLESCRVNMSDIDAFAVNSGPGSFTGVRIGVAAIKGMTFAGNKLCVGVSTLEAMAENLSFTNGIVCAAMDARCNQVYNALFLTDGKQSLRLCEDRALILDELADELRALTSKEKYGSLPIYFVGDGANLAFECAPDLDNRILLPAASRYQHASGTAAVAKRKLEAGEGVCGAELMPSYLRLPQAERELKAKNKNK